MGKKAKRPLTEEEQLQLDLQLETDLARLLRQHRNLERAHGGGGGVSGAKIARQRKQIQILEKENNNVLTDLFVATCSTKKTQDAKVIENLVALMNEHDDFDARIKEKKAYLQEIDMQIDQVKKEVIIMRGKQIDDTKYHERVMAGQKSVEALENKLDTAVKRFCTIQTQNRALRQEIEHLLIERITFNTLWERLLVNLSKGKKFMLDMIEQATIAYNERDEWVARLQALRGRAHTDLIIHTEEMVHLQQKLDHDGKLELFLGVKGQRRVNVDLERLELQKREQKRQQMQEHLNNCKEILAQIMDFTNIYSIEGVYSRYLMQEEANFATWNYINEIYTEMEQLTDYMVDIHEKIDVQRNLHAERGVRQTDNLVKYKKELEAATREADQVEAQLFVVNKQLGQLYDGTRRLFNICKCDGAPFLALLGDNTTINDYNIFLHLNILEGRVTELILKVYYDQKTIRKKEKVQNLPIKDKEIAHRVQLINTLVPTNPCPLCVDQEQVSDVIDILQFVQTREEVKVKLAKRLSLPDGLERLHNVSACHLPKSRQIMQRRYQ